MMYLVFYIFDVSNASLYIVKKDSRKKKIHKNTYIIYITHVLTHIV